MYKCGLSYKTRLFYLFKNNKTNVNKINEYINMISLLCQQTDKIVNSF